MDLPFLLAHLLLVMSSAPSAQFLARRAAGAAAACPSRVTRSSLLSMSAMENGVRFLSSVIRAAQTVCDSPPISLILGDIVIADRLSSMFLGFDV